MPYWREYYRESLPSGVSQTGSPAYTSDIGGTECVLVTSRSRPKSAVFDSVADAIADPTVNYLRKLNLQVYKANIEERGLKADTALVDRGHTFSLIKKRMSGTLPSGTHQYQQYSYSGSRTQSFTNLVPTVGPAIYGNGIPSTSTTQLEAFGQRAFSRAAPKSSQFDLTLFAGELREGLPRFGSEVASSLAKVLAWDSRTILRLVGATEKTGKDMVSGVGKDALNITFGAVPLVSDVMKLTEGLIILTQGLMSSNIFDRPVHRSYKEATIRSSVNPSTVTNQGYYLVNGGVTPASRFNVPLGHQGGLAANLSFKSTYSSHTETRRWFDGAFTRFLPSGYDGQRWLDRASVLFNTRLDPLTLWNLTPWSWLIDWYVDVSTFLSAHQLGVDKLLFAHYAYAMEHTTVVETLDWEIVQGSGYYYSAFSGPVKGTSFCRTDTKRRIRASPFGFQAGRTTGLSAYQSGVLGALALSKL